MASRSEEEMGRCSALLISRFTLLGFYHMDYTNLGSKASRRFL